MRQALLALLVLLCVGPMCGQVPIHTEPEVFVTAIDVVADVRDANGKVPAGLTIDDFIVLEEGREMKLIGLDYLRETGTPGQGAPPAPSGAAPTVAALTGEPPAAGQGDWQVVVYFETYLTSSTNRKKIADSLIKKVDDLVRMGRVDVVLADPVPTSHLRNSRDPVAITAALRKAGSHPGGSWLTSHRRDYYSTRMMGGTWTTFPARIVLPYIEEEVKVLQFFRTSLLKWLGSYGRYSPRALIIAMEGYDLDPLAFYRDTVSIDEMMTLQSFLDQTQLAQSLNRTGQALAAGGWTTINVAGEARAGWLDDTTQSGIGRVRSHAAFGDEMAMRPGPKSFVYRPLEPLQVMAEATGGSVVTKLGKLGSAIDGLSDRIRLTYQVARPSDDKVRRVIVRARRPDLKVRAGQWATSTTPQQMSEARAIALLPGGANGDLVVHASTKWDESITDRRKGVVQLATGLDPALAVLPGQSRAMVRVTFAVQIDKKGTFLVNRLITDYGGSTGAFKYSAPFEIPNDPATIIVLVEEINTGIWGYARLEVQ